MAPHAAHDLATRAQVIALKVIDASNQQIEQQTDVKERTIISIYNWAIQWDFDSKAEQPVICDIHVEDAPRSGHSSKQTDENKDQVLSKICLDHYGWEKTCAYIATEIGRLSPMTIWQILWKAGLRKTKSTRKSNFIQKMKKKTEILFSL